MSKLLSIIGPTATGKTRIAVRLAAALNGEIISADSRQVYRNMNIGTGKDLKEYTIDGQQIKYHLIDIVNAGCQYNVFEYKNDFLTAYNDICERGKLPILCGGSGMYIESVLQNYQLNFVPENKTFRASIAHLCNQDLIQKLAQLRPLHNTSDTNDRQRLVRALEIATFEQQTNQNKESTIASKIYYLHFEPSVLRERIAQRLSARFEQGMIEEVRNLLNSGITPQQLAYYGLEYKFIVLHLTGEMSYQQMYERLYFAICQFAKRQRTWFKKMQRNGLNFNIIDCSDSEEIIVKKIVLDYFV
ncbi:MAG: tRNA (adenosine(37)-N6)-dimethylallyltransferase MiaA [Bacteroidales bacterium]|jgi:tRNA dimethylallyltransferase|nr:tRNA (adenosine(37)-N6)-dimethylallyltransferase MiaA [Bacteroidales bacterium]